MAGGLFSTFCEVAGHVRWSMMYRMAQDNKLTPGKLLLLKLSTNFYLQCILESGKKSRVVKLVPGSITEVVCRNGNFTCYLSCEGGTSFILTAAKYESSLKYLLECLTTLKNGGIPVSQTSETIKVGKNSTPSKGRVIARPRTPAQTPKVKEPKNSQAQNNIKITGSQTTETTEVEKNSTPRKGRMISKPRTPAQTPKVKETKNSPALNNIKNTVNQTKKVTVQTSPRQSQRLLIVLGSQTTETTEVEKNSTPSKGRVIAKLRTPAQTPKVKEPKNSQALNNIKNTVNQTKKVTVQSQQLSTPTSRQNALQKPRRNIKKTALEKKDKRKSIIITEDDFDKENNRSTGLQSPNKCQSSSSDQWCSFGTLHKKSPSSKEPLEEGWHSTLCSPKPPAAKVKSFYGSASKNSIMLTDSNKKQHAKKSILDISNSYSPKPLPSISSRSLSQSEVITSKGFLNLGNTCYMNASLQSFLGLVPFVQELANREILKKVKRSSLYRCMYNLLCCKDENASSLKKENALKRLQNAIASSEMTKRFSGHLQNDAHEFMNICLDQMKEEVQVALRGKDIKQDEDDIQANVDMVCPIVRNFEGFLRKYIVCTDCKDLVTKDELFNHLSLNLPVSSGPVPVGCSLDTLLETFFKVEKIERKCEKCECDDAIQSFQIQALPRVMILHVRRSEYHKGLGTQEKNSDWINVFRFLDIGRFCNTYAKGPTPFSFRQNDSPSTLLNQKNETPSNDQDDFVTSKSRRRLDMSVETSSDFEVHSSDYAANSSDETPRISSDISSSNSRRLSDKEQLELATKESLKSKQLEDARADEALFYNKIRNANDNLPATRSTRKRTSSTEYDENIRARDASDEEDEMLIVDDSVATPTKRRKVGNDESSGMEGDDSCNDLVVFAGEDEDLERALELSRTQADLGSDELSQVEEAIKRSLEDESLDAEMLNLPEIPMEETSVLPTREEKDIPSHQYKLASIVRHLGATTSSGHYISDVVDMRSGQWIRYNDLSVKEVSEFDVRYRKESDGYIYFYLHKSCADEITKPVR